MLIKRKKKVITDSGPGWNSISKEESKVVEKKFGYLQDYGEVAKHNFKNSFNPFEWKAAITPNQLHRRAEEIRMKNEKQG